MLLLGHSTLLVSLATYSYALSQMRDRASEVMVEAPS